MRTFLKTMVVAVLVLVFTGAATAVVLDPSPSGSPRTDLGTTGVDPMIAGSAYSGLYGPSVSGGGSGFDGTEDHGFFIYEPVVGDGSIIAKVMSLDGGTNAEKMAGIMIRQSLDADALTAASMVMPTDYTTFPPARQAQAFYRDTVGGDTSTVDPAAGDAPGLSDTIRLTRSGDTITFAWFNPLSLTWNDYAESVSLPMTGTLYVGLAVSSNSNSQITTGNYRDVQVNFATPNQMVWDESGSGNWSDSKWIGSLLYPDFSSHVLLADTNSDTVTVTADREALSLTVDGGRLVIDTGQTLSIGETIDVGAGGFLEMNNGATLDVARGGSIAHLLSVVGDSAISTWAADVSVHQFGGNIYADHPGVFTLQGGGLLQLDNLTGTVNAPYTTFVVEAGGTLASKGAKPLGDAQEVILEGATLMVENPGAIGMVAGLTLTGDSMVDVDATSTSMGRLTMDAVTLTSVGMGGIGFDDTDITAGTAAVTFDTMTDTDIGALNLPMDAVEINKTGNAKLIVSRVGTNLDYANFNVLDGTLVGIYGSNPLGPNTINMSAGELVLANSSAGVATFENALNVTGDSTLTAGNAGLALSGMKSAVLGVPGILDVEIASGKTLSLQSTDDYVLNVAGVLDGGNVHMIDGTVILSGGGQVDSMSVAGGSLASTDMLGVMNLTTTGGAFVATGTFGVGDTLRVTSGSVSVGYLEADTIKVRGGAMVANGEVVGDLIDANSGSLELLNTANVVDAIFSGSAMVSASDLVVSNSLKRDDTTYSVNMDTFTATGADMLAGIDIAFGGNQLTVLGPGAINQTNANLTVTSDATLNASTTATAKFGNLTLQSGVANLQLVTGAPKGISFNDLTAADGTGISGKLTVQGDVMVGDSPGTLDVMGNLTLASTSVYAWELGPDGSDLINVSDNLALNSGWTLKIISDESFFVPSQHTLFTFGDSVFPSIPTFDLSEASGWRTGGANNLLGLKIVFDPMTGGGSVLLDVVPEPATWVMLLGVALMGVVGYVRRRRKNG